MVLNLRRSNIIVTLLCIAALGAVSTAAMSNAAEVSACHTQHDEYETLASTLQDKPECAEESTMQKNTKYESDDLAMHYIESVRVQNAIWSGGSNIIDKGRLHGLDNQTPMQMDKIAKYLKQHESPILHDIMQPPHDDHASQNQAVRTLAIQSELEKLYIEDLVTYTDANGIYTAAGSVKNKHSWSVTPALSVIIQDGPLSFKVQVPYNSISAGGELPFKVKIPKAGPHATLAGYVLDVAAGTKHNVTLDVIYDHTLVVHPNGSLTGFAVNSGAHTLYDPVLWAVAHGADGPLDVARSIPLGTIEEGETVPFQMHIDPAVSGATYYSCFAPSDESVFPLKAQRGDQEYMMRYESGAWLYRPVFSDDGTDVTIHTTNSYPFETFASVEIPAVTRAEEFHVLRNDESIDFVQSIDDMGMWHVSFDIRGQSQDIITIQGFEQGDTLPALIPDYIRHDMRAWALGDAQDSVMLESLVLLADRSLLPKGTAGEPFVPAWLAMLMIWWGDKQVDDDEAMAAISHVIEEGLIRFG